MLKVSGICGAICGCVGVCDGGRGYASRRGNKPGMERTTVGLGGFAKTDFFQIATRLRNISPVDILQSTLAAEYRRARDNAKKKRSENKKKR